MVWIRRIALALVAVAVFALVGVFLRSEYVLRKTYGVPLRTVAVPSDSVSIAEGHRLAKTHGCVSCHGHALEGAVFLDDPMLGYFVAGNLTGSVQDQSDSELERIIRQGVLTDGRSALGMPSAEYQHLSDHDLGAILAYLRSLPPADGPTTDIRAGPLARLGLAIGMFSPQRNNISVGTTPPATRPTERHALGEYLAMTSCSGCHGQDLGGSIADGAPDLTIVAGYSAEAFAQLLRTGEGMGERDLGIMSEASRERFAYFTEAEVDALHAFLQDRLGVSLDKPRQHPVAEPHRPQPVGHLHEADPVVALRHEQTPHRAGARAVLASPRRIVQAKSKPF